MEVTLSNTGIKHGHKYVYDWLKLLEMVQLDGYTSLSDFTLKLRFLAYRDISKYAFIIKVDPS